MTRRSTNGLLRPVGTLLSALLLLLLTLPMLALALAAEPTDLLAGVQHPLFYPALLTSLQTSSISLLLAVVTGTPLACWLSTTRTSAARLVEMLVDLPIVIPPAVVGVALLLTFGRRGLLGAELEALGVTLPFSPAAVVVAQTVVASPFYVQAAATALSRVDPDLVLVARTLGASPTRAFFSVTLPVALPGLLAGAALCWARALGEFGATLLFAGNLTGTTQTMPLAIYTALESDLRAAVSLSLCLGAMAVVLLLSLRSIPARLLRLERRAARSTTG